MGCVDFFFFKLTQKRHQRAIIVRTWGAAEGAAVGTRSTKKFLRPKGLSYRLG